MPQWFVKEHCYTGHNYGWLEILMGIKFVSRVSNGLLVGNLAVQVSVLDCYNIIVRIIWHNRQ